MEKRCTTCGWGMRWDRSSIDGNLHGRCQFKPTTSLPRFYVMSFFCESTPEEKNCPAWKSAHDSVLVPRWLEEWHLYLGRVADYFEQQQRELRSKIEDDKKKIIAEDPEMAATLGFI